MLWYWQRTMKPKQQRFVDEYLIDLNATQAAIRAGYSQKTAGQIGDELLKNPNVRAAVDVALAERSAATRIDATWVLKRLAEEASADVADLYAEDGSILPVNKWPKIWRQGLVQGIKSREIRGPNGEATGDHIVELRLSDRVKRIELIGKHIGVNAFQDVVKHTGLDALAERLERAAKRIGENDD